MQDPRTDPQQYGPPQPQPVRQPLTDQVEPLRQALQNMDPEMAYLVDSVGSTVGRRSNADVAMKAALTDGATVKSLREQVQAADAAEAALKAAEESMTLDDSTFDKLLGQLDQETNQMPQVPQRGAFEQPSHLEQGIAAFTSLGTPEHAFDIGAVPYQVSAMRREEQYGYAQDRYKSQLQGREDRLQLLKLRLTEQNRRDLAQLEVKRQAGDKKAKAVMDAVQDLLNAKRPNVARAAWMQLADPSSPAYDAKSAQTYKSIMDEIEADNQKEWQAKQNQVQAQTEATNALRAQREFQVRKGEALLDFQVQTAKDKNALDAIKIQLGNSQVKMLPQTEELLRQRVEMAKLKNRYYPTEVSIRATTAQFYMGMATANFDRLMEVDRRDRDQWWHTQAEDAKEQKRLATQEVLDSTEAERKYALDERDSYDKNSGDWKRWDRYAGKLEGHLRNMRNQLSGLSNTFGGERPELGDDPSRPEPGQITIPFGGQTYGQNDPNVPTRDNPLGGNIGTNRRPGGDKTNTTKKKDVKKGKEPVDLLFSGGFGPSRPKTKSKSKAKGPSLPKGWN